MKAQLLSFSFCCAVALGFSTASQGQDLQFDKGLLKVAPPETFIYPAKPTTSNTNNTLTAQQVATIRRDLRIKIENTSYNLGDERLHKFYDKLWGANWTDAYVKELQEFSNYLANDVAPDSSLLVPAPSDLSNLFSTSYQLYTLEETQAKDKYTVQVIGTDAFARWLKGYYESKFVAGISSYNMDASYKTSWKSLETLAAEMKAVWDKLDKKINTMYSCGGDQDILDGVAKAGEFDNAMNTNKVIGMFTNNTFFKQWLWYNEGILTTNPFFISEPGRDYTGNAADYTALGKEAYRTMLEDGKARNTAFFNAEYVYNKTQLLYSEKKGEKRMWHIDAMSGYDNDEMIYNKRNLTEDDDITLVINNAHKDLVYELDENKIRDLPALGIYTDGLGNAAEAMRTVVSPVNGLASTFVSLLAPFNDKRAIIGTDDVTRFTTEKSDVQVRAFISSVKVNKGFAILNNNAPQKPIVIIDNGIAYTLTGDSKKDKKSLLEEYYTYHRMEKYFAKKYIDEFLIDDITNPIVYTTPATISKTVADLFNNFERFKDKFISCNLLIKSSMDMLEERLVFLNAFIAIPNRSLPPTKLTISRRHDAPVYRTVLEPIAMDGLVEKGISLAEIKKKDTTEKNVVYTNRLKIGKYIIIGGSVGIAFTWPAYERKKIEVENGLIKEIKDDNDRVRVVAGINIYPQKINYNDNSIVRWGNLKHRWSVFGGVGVPDPLNNFYLGIGIDIVPGIKIINGMHLIRHTKYTLFNNTIADQADGLRVAGGYTSLSIDPTVITKIFGL